MPPLSPEVAQLLGMLEKLTGNNLSSVEITRNSKGKNSCVKVYHENPLKAQEIAEQIDNEIRSRP